MKKKNVSFDPQIFKAVCDYQANLIKEWGKPVSFSQALNELLKSALEPLETLEPGGEAET